MLYQIKDQFKVSLKSLDNSKMKTKIIMSLLSLVSHFTAFAAGSDQKQNLWTGISAQRREGKLGDKNNVFMQGIQFNSTARMEFGWLGALGGGVFGNFEKVRKSSAFDKDEYQNVWSHNVMSLGLQGVVEIFCVYGRIGYVNQNHFFDAKTVYDNRSEFRNIAGDGYTTGYGLYARVGGGMLKFEIFNESIKLYPKYIHGGLMDNFHRSESKGLLIGFEGRIR